MQSGEQAGIGYGMLAFDIFGNLHLAGHERFLEASRRYAASHNYDEPLPKLPMINCLQSLERQLLSEYLDKKEFPEPFLQAVDRAVASLDDRHRMVVEMRYGLADGDEKTHKEIASKMPNKEKGGTGVTEERIAQMKRKALRLLRHPSRARSIKSGVTDEALRSLFGFNMPEYS